MASIHSIFWLMNKDKFGSQYVCCESIISLFASIKKVMRIVWSWKLSSSFPKLMNPNNMKQGKKEKKGKFGKTTRTRKKLPQN
jgi:hypothetical protein